ncbi:helix-turn-helix domain-containing protein [Rhodopila sp.]|uniref:helix-turn-helix domain-containing protein n=1 Tax=Rhodopila sp. TaxID=2480087 RepID=UPI003D0E6266
MLTRLSLSASGAAITGEDVAAVLDGAPVETQGAAASTPARLRGLIRGNVRETLVSTSGNISEAARRLGVSRNTVYRALAGRELPP